MGLPELGSDATALVVFLVVSTAVGIAVVTDTCRARIDNWLTIPLIMTGLLFHTASPGGLGWEYAFGGAWLGFALLFLPFLGGGIRTGDLKLMTGVGAWFGPRLTLGCFFVIALMTAFYFLPILFSRRAFREAMMRLQIVYCRISALLAYLASEDPSGGLDPRQSGRRENAMRIPALIFIATLVLLGLLIAFWI